LREILVLILTKSLFFRNYSGILPQRHKGTKIIGLILYNSLFNAWNIEINEKTPLFNLYPSSLWVFVPWWLNSYVLPRGKGNGSQQMGNYGRAEIRKCVYLWQKR